MGLNKEIEQLIESFPTVAPSGRNFFEGEDEAIARDLGKFYWPTPERAYSNFLHAYAALFAIPPFVREALARQPNRFDRDQLPHTVATTSGFILDAFGFDRRTNRRRDVIYSPAPAIRASHARRINHTGHIVRERISDAAMIYFGIHLMRAGERKVTSDECRVTRNNADSRHSTLDARHFSYFRTFFREAGYRFPDTSDQASVFCALVDEQLSGHEFASLWDNLLEASRILKADVTPDSIARFLLPRSASIYGK